MKSSIPAPAIGRILGTVYIVLAAHGPNAVAQTCVEPSSDSLFNLNLCVEGDLANAQSSAITDIIRFLKEERLALQFPGYEKGVSAGEYRLDVRGLPVNLSQDRNATALQFEVPSLGIDETFDGGNRNASVDLFEDYIKKNGDYILRELLRVSSMDPLAGNPASVQSQMAASAYGAGVDPVYDTLKPGSSLGLGARFGSYSLGQFVQNVFTLPIEYSYTFSNYDKLIVRAPLSYMEVDGAESYQGNVGVSYKRNILRNWALTPSLGYGIAGSADLASLGQILSGSLTSDLMLYYSDKYQLSMGNMVGYYWTLPTSGGEFSVDYDLENTIIRNGLLFSMPLETRIWGRDFSIDMYLTDTRFFGDALYSDNYQEIGISMGPMRSSDKLAPNLSSHPIGLGIKYIQGAGDIQGIEVGFGYRF